MKLTDFIKMGSIADADAVKRTVEWNGNTFDVLIKPKPTVADFEFVYAAKADDDSYGARRVNRFVVLDGGERIPYEKAKQLDVGLVRVLSTVINEVHGDTAAKKN